MRAKKPSIFFSFLSRGLIFSRACHLPKAIHDNVTIDFLKPDDIAELSSVAKLTYRQTYSDYSDDWTLENLFGEHYKSKTLPAELKNENYIYLTAKRSGRIIGYAKLILLENNSILDKLYFLSEYLGKSYGQEMLQTCVEIALERGSSKMNLIVYAENTRAVNFYIKYGFDPGEKKPHFHLVTKEPTGKFHYEMMGDLEGILKQNRVMRYQ